MSREKGYILSFYMLLSYRIWPTKAIQNLFAMTSLSLVIITRFFRSLRIRFASSFFSYWVKFISHDKKKRKKKKKTPLVVKRFINHGYFFFRFTFPLILWYPEPHVENWIEQGFFNLRNHWSMFKMIKPHNGL